MMILRVPVIFALSVFVLGQEAPAGQPSPPAAPTQQPAASSSQQAPATPVAPPAGTPQVTLPPAPAADQPHPGQTAPAEPEAKQVPETAVVITIKGACAARATAKAGAAARKPAECKTVVTRAEWEKLLRITRPIPPQLRRRAAEQYVDMVALADAARKAGLENSPEVQERLKVTRMDLLGRAYLEKLREQYSHASPAEVQDYYKQHAADYEELTLKRIYVPKGGKVDDKPVEEAAVKSLAEKLRQRAAAGEDFEKLQKEAFESTGNKGTPPASELGEKRRGTLPPKHEDDAFKLKPGEVSPAYEEASGFFIYKVEKKETAALDKVKGEIERTVETEKLRVALEKVKDSVKPEFNDAYFGPLNPQPAEGEKPAGPPQAGPSSTAPAEKPAGEAAHPAESKGPAAQPAPPPPQPAPK